MLVGDTVMVSSNGRWASFMRSYPNYLPLPERLVRGIVAALRPWPYDRMYGAFPSGVAYSGAKQIVEASAVRYIGWLRDETRDPDDPAPSPGRPSQF